MADRHWVGSPALGPHSDGFDPGILKARRPPDWSTARVLRGPDGASFVVVRLGGAAPRPAGDGMVSTGMMVFEVADQGFVRSGKILEFLTPEAGASATLGQAMGRHWSGSFPHPFAAVVEFSTRYAPLRGRVYRRGEVAREARVQVQVRAAGPGKTQARCYYVILCFYEPDTGELLYCDPDTLILLYCEGDDGDGGGGDGGDDDDDDEEEEEDDCACDEEIPCAMEAEYEEYGVSPAISCDQFTSSGGSANFSWTELNGDWAGGNEYDYYPWGYIHPNLTTGLELARTAYGDPLGLSSGYRCPEGNNSIPDSAPQSFHMQGLAADVPSAYGCTEVETAFWAAHAADVIGCEDHPNHVHGRW